MSEITKETLEYVVGLSQATSFSVPADSEAAFDRPLHRPPLPAAKPLAKPLEVSTLRSFAEYITANRDALKLDSYIIHVASAQRVELVSALEDLHRRRETPIVAVYAPPDNIFDKWVDLETAIVGLMSLCTNAGDRDAVLELLKKVTREGMEIREDSGLSQNVTIKDGIRTVERATTPNPVMLAPFRVFPEVAQPVSPFVLRLRGEPSIQVALRTADGGAWKAPAAESIAVALERMLSEGHPPILH
jgi:hypothetical protein